jgi:GT2 family glycosyltransferase
MRDILIVAATRKSRLQFERSSFLGASLRRLAFDDRIKSSISYKNTDGLSAVFNREITKMNRRKILVFTHDDVRIDDYWFSRRLDQGLRSFDVLGVAGNRRRIAGQASWAFTPSGKWDKAENLSGAVGHFEHRRELVSFYGDPGRNCKSLDGVLIVVKASTLINCGLSFDERFAFRFYDLDFCRSAEKYGLSLGTWPIAVTHGSGGSFGSPEWKRALKLYRMKWHE